MPCLLALFYRSFGPDANTAGRDYKLGMLIPIFGDGLREDQFAGPPTLPFPGLPRLYGGGQDIAGPGMAVIFVVLFRMQTCPTTTAALGHSGGFFPRAKPGLPNFGPQAIVGIKLRTGLDKRRWGNDR